MRLLVTADLHFNHARSKPLAEDIIDRMNAAGGDAVLLVGDTAIGDGDSLEQCLSRFRIPGPKLFVAGNHELWTLGSDSHEIFIDVLPRRVRDLGWHWLQTQPAKLGSTWIVGSVGWYDYSFAQPELGIPRRFYEGKLSPGAAERLSEYADLFHPADDIGDEARKVIARWNDGKFVKLHRPDDQFLDELLDQLRSQLAAIPAGEAILAAVHHLPFRELLPPARSIQWDFTKAYLGSERLGQLLLEFPAITQVFCGHSHFPAEAQIGSIKAINIGSGYGWKTFKMVELAE